MEKFSPTEATDQLSVVGINRECSRLNVALLFKQFACHTTNQLELLNHEFKRGCDVFADSRWGK
jgi:hypothetical protein